VTTSGSCRAAVTADRGAGAGTTRSGAWRRRRLADARLYLCCDRQAGGRGDLAGFLETVLGAGVDLVQLRDKTADHGELVAAAAIFRAAADRHGALFVANDDPALAVEADADGIHVGQDDPPPAAARAVVGPDRIVGRSTHSVAEFDRALTEDCDYAALGPVHATPTKLGRPAIGLDPLRHAARVADRPWFVTGAMARDTAPAVLATGARRLVVVRALTEAPDPAAATAALVALLRTAGDA
jgi:thiamine-phosphate pyrophosphorylase